MTTGCTTGRRFTFRVNSCVANTLLPCLICSVTTLLAGTSAPGVPLKRALFLPVEVSVAQAGFCAAAIVNVGSTSVMVMSYTYGVWRTATVTGVDVKFTSTTLTVKVWVYEFWFGDTFEPLSTTFTVITTVPVASGSTLYLSVACLPVPL